MTDGTITRRALAALALSLAWAAPGLAQDYPNNVIHVISAHPPGGGADILIRNFAEKLQAVSGATVIVENKPGADGAIGVKSVIVAKPDGYTILINVSSAVIGNTFTMKDANYDAEKDLIPVATIGTNCYVLVAGPKSGVTTLAEVLAQAKQRDVRFGIQNTAVRSAMELLKIDAGVNFTPVNYRGASAVLTALNGGEVDFAFSDPTSALAQAKQGRVVPIAVTYPQRARAFPDIPTIAEGGLKGYAFSDFWGVWVPVGTPDAVVQKIEGWFEKIIGSDESKQFLEKWGIDAVPGDHRVLATLMHQGVDSWGTIARKAGIEKQ